MVNDFDQAAVEQLSAAHHRARARIDVEQQRAYTALEEARRASGVARIVMGVHLVSLHDSEGWRGRTGAKSFRRFLQEECIEPTAAYQYMDVARAFVLEHGVAPARIALVSMRVLKAAIPFLKQDDPLQGLNSNVDEVIDVITSLPSAEAQEALKEEFSPRADIEATKPRMSSSVSRILSHVDGLTFDQRSELYQALRAGTAPHATQPAFAGAAELREAQA